MKYLLFIVVLIVSTSKVSAQLNASYEEIQEKYGAENINIDSFDSYFSETKNFGDKFRLTFTYDSNRILKMVSAASIDDKINKNQFNIFSKEMMPFFKLTSKAENENTNFYYDSKNKLLSVFEKFENKKKYAKKVTFVSSENLILKINPEISKMK